MRNIPAYTIDDLLVKYLLQEATADEQQGVNAWLQQSRQNRQYFDHFKLIWEESHKLASTSFIHEDDAWIRFKEKTKQVNNAKVIPIRRRPAWPKLLAAAVFGGFIFFSVIYWQHSNKRQMATVNAGQAVINDSLTDGTIVTLNKNSMIAYDKKFTGSSRNLSLKGEAFFNVAPDKNKPFIISVNDVTIKVVGTSFNVKSIHGNTEVIVETGVVEVYHKSKKIDLKPKEKIVVKSNETELIKDSSNSKLYNYYRTKVFVCDDTPLWQLVATLNEAYNTHIVIGNKSIANLPLTTTFDEQPLEKILYIVTTTLKITADQNGNQITLR